MLKIGEILKDSGLVSASDVDKALAEQKRTGKFIGAILVETGKITETDLLKCLSLQMHIDFLKLSQMTIPREVIDKVPVKYVWHYKVMPVRFDKNTLTIAVSDPLNLWPLEDIKLHLNVEIEPVLACAADIEECLRKYYGVGANTIDRILSKEEGDKKKAPEGTGKVEDIAKLAGGASVINLVNEIIKEAVESNATDIHFEPYEDELVVRYRIDGMLQPTKISEDIRFLYSSITARIKVMADMDIVERRLPQSGGMRVRLEGREFDLRVSMIPNNYGEGVVIRVLPTQMLLDLPQLGVEREDVEKIERLINRPHGIVYVTGPTGSGKTTTLYACLNRLNRPEVKIITVEDPVEYKIKHIEQIQVNSKISLTFSNILRSVLRHDPDIIMVGEVRDAETAQIAVQASLTGHFVLSTLHTNDAPSAVTRLLDMGVEPFLVSSSVIAMIAQRLLRKVCPDCGTDADLDSSTLPKELQVLASRKVRIKKAVGCENCRGTGYKGRVAIYEILPFSAAVKELTVQKASASQIREAARREGMKTLLEAGWEKVVQNVTTIEELLRIVQESVS